MKKRLSAFFAEQQGTILKFALTGIIALFLTILVVVYFVAKEANPIMLDESGKPIQSQ